MYRIRDNEHLVRRGVIYERRDVNKLIMFPGETLKHFLAKSILFHKLRELKHDVVTEFEITGCGVGDILDLTSNVQYEVECHPKRHIRDRKLELYKRTGCEIIIVDCSRLPINLTEASGYLERFILPTNHTFLCFWLSGFMTLWLYCLRDFRLQAFVGLVECVLKNL